MKSPIIRMIFVLALLLTFGAVFGGVNFVKAHATAASPNTMPTIHRAPCGVRSDFFRIATDNEKDYDCFANGGTMNVNLYGANIVCTGNNIGNVVWRGGSMKTVFPTKYTCYYINGNETNYVHITQITIN